MFVLINLANNSLTCSKVFGRINCCYQNTSLKKKLVIERDKFLKNRKIVKLLIIQTYERALYEHVVAKEKMTFLPLSTSGTNSNIFTYCGHVKHCEQQL